MRISDWSSDVCSSDLYIERWVHYDERWFLPDMAFANLKVILLNGIWKPLVFNINAQGFIPLALPRQKQSAFADTRINNQSALFNVRANDREQKFADVVRGTDGRLFFVLVVVVAIDPIDRKSVVSGKRVSVRVDLGGRRIIKTTNTRKTNNNAK